VVKPEGTAEVRPVVVGDYIGDKNIVVVDGLRAGDRLVVDGALKVVPGQPVQVVDAGAAAGASAEPAEAAAKKK
jgi:membrane fusion protein, multidrug efflux system